MNYYQKRDVSKRLLQNMVSALEHRGPDDVGTYTKGNIGLGVRRLSIIDLETGHQPIANEDNTIWIVYNGEIYNYKELRQDLEKKGHTFQTNSDTEVLVHLYEEMGRDLVTQLNGMFAFAVWDAKHQTLLLARDRIGIKPLFYHIGRDKLTFASELKSLLHDPVVSRDVNMQAVNDYFSLLYVPETQSIFKNIRKLPPAHTLEYVDGEVSIQRYWTVPYQPLLENESGKAVLDSAQIHHYAAEVRERLKEAVRRRMISDVPLGAFLSGGIDSSAIAGFMSQLTDIPIKTFSIGFPNAGYYDERKYARKVSSLFNTQHYEFEVDPNALEILPLLIKYFDEPFADSSAIPTYYLSKLARQYVTVCLSGTGGDEIFAGYRRYLIENLFEHYQKYPKFMQSMALNLSKALPVSRTSALKEYFLLLKRFLDSPETSPMMRHINMMTCFHEDAKQQLYGEGIDGDLTPSEYVISQYYKRSEDLDDLARTLFADFHTYLPGDLLVKEDRMTMAASLEGRVPFLDHELVEYIASLPSELKIRKLTTKYILKEALRPLLPASIINRRKHGFGVPIGEWFKKELKSYTADLFHDQTTIQRGYLNHEYVLSLLDEHQKGTQDYSSQLWAVLVFELWCREYLDTPAQVDK